MHKVLNRKVELAAVGPVRVLCQLLSDGPLPVDPAIVALGSTDLEAKIQHLEGSLERQKQNMNQNKTVMRV